MSSLSELENLATQLVAATRNYSSTCRSLSGKLTNGADPETDRTRRDILNLSTRLQTQLLGPADFIQQLAVQNQLLACLRWLGTNQIPACIPLTDSISARELADISGVPEVQLCRIVRMMATAGFLREPRPGHFAHTTLSSPFVTNLAYFDAGMFLAETAAPAALHMTSLAQRHSSKETSTRNAYTVPSDPAETFEAASANHPQLRRRWMAYQQCVQDARDNVAELLSRLNWDALGNACIVDVGAPSTETAFTLAKLFPNLRFTVQMVDPSAEQPEDCNGRIVVQQRTPTGPQPVKDAAAYILRLPSAWMLPSPDFTAALSAHLPHLRANPLATLILAPLYLPEPGSVGPLIEASARARDLSRQQLVNECELEVGELVDILTNLQDDNGRFFVANKIYSRDAATLALGVKYEANCYGSTAAETEEQEASKRVPMNLARSREGNHVSDQEQGLCGRTPDGRSRQAH